MNNFGIIRYLKKIKNKPDPKRQEKPEKDYKGTIAIIVSLIALTFTGYNLYRQYFHSKEKISEFV